MRIAILTPLLLLAVACATPATEDSARDTGPDLSADADADGLPDWQELVEGTDPNSNDTDGDGLDDATEVAGTTDPTTADTDSDGLMDGDEDTNGNGQVDAGETDPTLADTDGDSVPDGAEVAAGTDPNDPDSDDDGLDDAEEWLVGTNALVADTDGDGLSDFDEWWTHGTDPLEADTDGDGLTDGDEVAIGADPFWPDTDGDGLSDGDEVAMGTNPLSADSDGDGLDDAAEVTLGTTATDADSDADGLEDADEVLFGTNPLDSDTDGDLLTDGEEATLGTNPLVADTDGDGTDDGTEVDGGTDPLVADPVLPDLTPDATACASGGSFASIQAAIDAAADGDTIEVCAGTYNERLYIEDKAVHLIGPDGPQLTIVNAQDAGRPLTIDEPGAPVYIDGLTFRGGNTTEYGGGAFVRLASVVLRNSALRDNRSATGAGALYAPNTEVTLDRVVIDGNSQPDDAQYPLILVWGSRFLLQNSEVTNNDAGRSPTLGVSRSTAMPAPYAVSTIRNSLFAWNTQLKRLATYNPCAPLVRIETPVSKTHNSVFANNTCDQRYFAPLVAVRELHGSIFLSNEAQSMYRAGEILRNAHDNISWNADDCPFDCTLDWPGELEADPLFNDAAGGDFSLQTGSPAIDSGYAHAGYADSDGTRNDIGLYGGPWAWEE